MAHILKRLGEAALKARRAGTNGNVWLPPILSRRRAMEIRAQRLEEGKCVCKSVVACVAAVDVVDV
jgi:hypothetical protein